MLHFPATTEKPLKKAICANVSGFCFAQNVANNSTLVQLDFIFALF